MPVFTFSGLKHSSTLKRQSHGLLTLSNCLEKYPIGCFHDPQYWANTLHARCILSYKIPQNTSQTTSGSLKAEAAIMALFRALKAPWLSGVHAMYFLVEDRTRFFPIPFNWQSVIHTTQPSQRRFMDFLKSWAPESGKCLPLIFSPNFFIPASLKPRYVAASLASCAFFFDVLCLACPKKFNRLLL